MGDSFEMSALLEMADEALDQAVPEVETAQALLEQAHRQEPENTRALDKLAEFHCNFGDPSVAEDLFKKSIHLNPNQGSGKYLYLAQMCEGREALHLYEKGLVLCEQAPAEKVTIYIAVSELYMTDLCDDADAQMQCERALQMAQQIDPHDLEVNIALATYKKTIGEVDKAIEFARMADNRLQELEAEQDRTMGSLFAGPECGDGEAAEREDHGDCTMEEPREGGKTEDSGSDTCSDDEKPKPTSVSGVASVGNTRSGAGDNAGERAPIFEVPTEVQVKLIMTQIDLRMFEEAERILEKLLEEDEEDVQCWYLSGLCQCCQDDKEEALAAYKEALKLCRRYPQNKAIWGDNLRSLKQRIDKIDTPRIADHQHGPV